MASIGQQIRKAKLITDNFGLEKDSYILFLGRLVPEKGIRYLVEAFKNVKTDKKLVIAGGSSDTDSFMEELKELAKGDDRILFTGFVQGAMLDELYSNAYIYTLPSDLEGMPLSLLEAMLDRGEGEYTYRCILTNDYESSVREIVEFYNLRGGKERIFDDLNNGFGWDRLPKSFMAENTVFLLLTALVRNFYKFIMERLEVKKFGLKATSRIKAFVFKFITVPAKWIRTSRQFILNIYTDNQAYGELFNTDFG